MLDSQGRITIIADLFSRQELISYGQKVDVCFNYEENIILIKPENGTKERGEYFIKRTSIDRKGRMIFPAILRKAFPDAAFVPAEKDGNLYILILNNKKSE